MNDWITLLWIATIIVWSFVVGVLAGLRLAVRRERMRLTEDWGGYEREW